VAPGTRFEARRLGPAAERRPPRWRLPLIGAAVLLLAVGVAIGRIIGPSGNGTVAEPVTGPEPSVPSTPSAPVEPTIASTAPTREGAARAAARALSSLADARLLLSRAARRAAVARIAPSSYRAELDPLFDRTYDYLAGILGAPARQGEVVLQMTPLGYRVEAFTTRHATVAVWQVTLLATPDRAPIAAWSTSRAELTWSRGRWRIERFGIDTPGPVPSVTAPAAPTGSREFVSAARGFSPFSR
jgi:hypothetical protein